MKMRFSSFCVSINDWRIFSKKKDVIFLLKSRTLMLTQTSDMYRVFHDPLASASLSTGLRI
jgi:hypothetical protein